jgi:hypothetical protein
VTKKQIEKNRQLNAEFLKKIGEAGVHQDRPCRLPEAMAEFQKRR